MTKQEFHLSDAQLIRELDRELSTHEAKQAAEHLAECWRCRARRQQLESAVGDFVRAQAEDGANPPVAGPRAMLKARLNQMPVHPETPAYAWAMVAAACVLLGLALWFAESRRADARRVVVSIPDSRLTPGAAVLVNRGAVCSQANTKNKTVPVTLRRKVFEAYGIADAQARDYEVDYLITPALGGADDIHNLWPQSYSATAWNAEVKDALEDRLRQMVCDGELDLEQAQQEIARNWVDAYKKYFHTETPLPQNR